MSVGMADGGKIARLPEHPGAGPIPGWYEAWLAPEAGFDLEDLKQNPAALGLLIPAGDATMELVAPGYERQPVKINGCIEGAMIVQPVAFGTGPETWPRLWGAALYDHRGTLVAKGPITLKSDGLTYARLCFRACGVVVLVNPEAIHA